MSVQPPAVAVIGAGPHGVTVALALADALGRDAVLLIDPAAAPLESWSARARAIGMRRMRSPWVHHCGLDPKALYRYAGPHGPVTDKTPPVELFESHARHLLERAELAPRRAWVSRLERHDESWEVVLHWHPAIAVQRVVLAGGLDPHRRRGLGGLPLPDGPAAARDGRVAVIGAGHTGASAALHILRAGGRVDLFAARGLRERRTDVEPGWFGPKHLRPFAVGDAAHRRQRLREARIGTTTPHVAERLRALRPCGRFRLREGRVAALAGPPGLREVCTTDGVAHGPYEVVYEATGYEVSIANEPLLAGLDVPVHEGLPILDEHLQALPGLHLTGGLAELALGPAGRNLWGAQRAAERIVAAATGHPAPVLGPWRPQKASSPR
jgi:cation diffusion facilitator CzcD-associated flavoprotein CzcO